MSGQTFAGIGADVIGKIQHLFPGCHWASSTNFTLRNLPKSRGKLDLTGAVSRGNLAKIMVIGPAIFYQARFQESPWLLMGEKRRLSIVKLV